MNQDREGDEAGAAEARNGEAEHELRREWLQHAGESQTRNELQHSLLCKQISFPQLSVLSSDRVCFVDGWQDAYVDVDDEGIAKTKNTEREMEVLHGRTQDIEETVQTEQEIWEQHQLKYSTVKFGSSKEAERGAEFDYVFEDQIVSTHAICRCARQPVAAPVAAPLPFQTFSERLLVVTGLCEHEYDCCGEHREEEEEKEEKEEEERRRVFVVVVFQRRGTV